MKNKDVHYATKSFILITVRYASIEILQYVQNVIKEVRTIGDDYTKLFDFIKDRFEEYHDYLEETSDTINNALSYMKENLMSRVKNH